MKISTAILALFISSSTLASNADMSALKDMANVLANSEVQSFVHAATKQSEDEIVSFKGVQLSEVQSQCGGRRIELLFNSITFGETVVQNKTSECYVALTVGDCEGFSKKSEVESVRKITFESSKLTCKKI